MSNSSESDTSMSPAESELEFLDPLTLPDPLLSVTTEYRTVAIVGVGLIGGSIGLRLKSLEFMGTVIGCDRQEIVDEALARGIIDSGCTSVEDAVGKADLILLCVPISVAAELLPRVLRSARDGAVITDTCPVKKELLELAAKIETRADYIGGHPLAGSDRQGISNADPNLFESAYWLLVPAPDTPAPKRESLAWWIRMLGAYPLTLTAERHDHVVAMTTHVPLIVTMALTAWVADRSKDEQLLTKLATGGFRDVTSLAALPKEAWADVLRSNKAVVLNALAEYRNVLDECIARVNGDSLGEYWRDVHDFQKKILRERPGDWDANSELIITTADRPGAIAKIASLLAMHDINIRDIGVLYVREQRGGSLRVILESLADARRAVELLRYHGFTARQKL